jgi:hypothetical protein
MLSEVPFVSCYLDLRRNFADWLWKRARSIQEHPSHLLSRNVIEAMDRIEHFLSVGLRADSQGAAIVCRAGSRPYFVAFQFQVPLTTSLEVQSKPCIYGLLEILETYDHYIAMHSSANVGKIVEIHLGVAENETLWHRQPCCTEHSGGDAKFLTEQIRLLDHVMSTGRYRYLTLSGESTMVSRIVDALPASLVSKRVVILEDLDRDGTQDIVGATLPPFLEYVERESLASAIELKYTDRPSRLRPPCATVWRG